MYDTIYQPAQQGETSFFITVFGARHALVANLHNNLGVCRMHLHQWDDARRYLQTALDIQRELLGVVDGEDYLSQAPADARPALLELADTLFNIGGLCLERIRRQGPDARHARDAEAAFGEAWQIREHLDAEQVAALHGLVQSVAVEPVEVRAGAGASASPMRRRVAGDPKERNERAAAWQDVPASAPEHTSIVSTPMQWHKATSRVTPPSNDEPTGAPGIRQGQFRVRQPYARHAGQRGRRCIPTHFVFRVLVVPVLSRRFDAGIFELPQDAAEQILLG